MSINEDHNIITEINQPIIEFFKKPLMESLVEEETLLISPPEPDDFEETYVKRHSDIKFIHFDSNKGCDDFIKYLQKNNIIITHKCCNGNGCGIINSPELDYMIKDYQKKNE